MKTEDCSDVSISQGRLNIARKPTLARKKRGRSLTYRFLKEQGSDNTLISDL